MEWRDNISPKRAWNESIIASCIYIIIGCSLTFSSIQHLFFPWDKSDFIKYHATLETSPIFKKSRSGPSLKLKLKEASNFEFTIDGDNYTVLQNKNAIKELKTGTRVSVLVDKSQFNAKIAESETPTFVQKTINWKWIRVYEFKNEEQTFLVFNQVIEELKNVSKIYLIFGLICCIGTFFYIKYEYRIYKNSKK
jgi:hypothetical protein